MKAITIKQPFASLIAAGIKEYEFRTWKTHYRGEILIHAGMGKDKDAMQKFASGLDCPGGYIVARAYLSACIRVDDAFRAILREKNPELYSWFIKHTDWEGYAFKLEQMEKISPIPCKGRLSIWEYTPDAEMIFE